MSALARLLEQATPGPWELSDAERDMGREWRHVYMPSDGGEVLWQTPSDARLIALAPDMALLLLDMADAVALARGYIPRSEQFEALDLDALLARFAELEQRAAQ